MAIFEVLEDGSNEWPLKNMRKKLISHQQSFGLFSKAVLSKSGEKAETLFHAIRYTVMSALIIMQVLPSHPPQVKHEHH
jgi:hypothetical protein